VLAEGADAAGAPIVWNAGDLDLTSGLLVILDRALSRIQPGETALIESTNLSLADDLFAWCKISGHEFSVQHADGEQTVFAVTKGRAQKLLLDEAPEWGVRANFVGGRFETKHWAVGRFADVPNHASTNSGFAPRGAVLELHSPKFPFSINDKAQVWADEVRDLYDQAVANQWNASTDIAWHELPSLPEEIERAVCQVMTFLIENEYAALYVPSKFVSRINSQYLEVVLFLSTQIMDEARHIEAFTKRALANGGGMQVCTASTEHSLKTLMEQPDFSCASFLLSVLGEGTFLDLLKFIEDVSPDPVTKEVVRRARVDETRHVHFAMAHIKYFLSHTPSESTKLVAALEERARVLQNVTSLNELVMNALTILAGGGVSPTQVRAGAARVHAMLQQMDENRRKRLMSIGFSATEATQISALHTPNFM
jgi:TusA-related sulfurtransferase